MQVEQIPLTEIEENENNSYAQTGIDELAESIKVIGLQQPLVVRRKTESGYLLLAGHRRRNALAQLDHAACLQILERGLNLLGGLTGVLSGQTAAAACHGVGPVQDQHLQGRVKISVKHNAGRGLAVEQRQCVPAAVSGEQ